MIVVRLHQRWTLSPSSSPVLLLQSPVGRFIDTLCLQEDALASGDTQHLTTILPNIFCKGLSTDENHMTWLLLVDVLLPSLGSMPLQEKRYFVEDFFGYVSSRRNNQAEQDRSMMSSRSEDEDIPGPVDMPTVTATSSPGRWFRLDGRCVGDTPRRTYQAS